MESVVDSLVKRCPKCTRTLPASSFNMDRSKKNGLASRCRECNKAACLQWADDNRVRKQITDRRYYRLNKEKVKASSARWRENNRARCVETTRAWMEAHPELVRDQRARYRARLRDVPVFDFTLEQLIAKVEYWGSRCWICHGDYDSIDHVKPIAAGGWHILANLRPICRSCNSSKKASWPFDTRRRQ